MTIRQAQDKLEELCGEFQDGIPEEEVRSRIDKVRSFVIKRDHWIPRNKHLLVQVSGALYNAGRPSMSYSEARWLVNTAQGLVEEAIAIEQDEWTRGVPVRLSSEGELEGGDFLGEWIQTFVRESNTEFVKAQVGYETFVSWLEEAEPGVEPCSLMNFGKRLSNSGFTRVTKRFGDKTEKVWMITISDIELDDED